MLEDRGFSVEEIAPSPGIKRDTVYKWIAEKRTLTHRMGRLWKFRQVRSKRMGEIKRERQG